MSLKTSRPAPLPLSESAGRYFDLLRYLDVERLAASAAALLVRIAEHEAGLQLVFDEIHFRAEHEHRRLGIDEDPHAPDFHDLVRRSLLVGVFERVAEARAAA